MRSAALIKIATYNFVSVSNSETKVNAREAATQKFVKNCHAPAQHYFCAKCADMESRTEREGIHRRICGFSKQPKRFLLNWSIPSAVHPAKQREIVKQNAPANALRNIWTGCVWSLTSRMPKKRSVLPITEKAARNPFKECVPQTISISFQV